MRVRKFLETLSTATPRIGVARLAARFAIPIIVVSCAFGTQGLAAERDDPWSDILSSSDTEMQLQWAIRYEHGEGLARDPQRARALYCLAAHRGSADAQYALGWMYANARGVQRNDALALAWFELAAQQGDEYARRMVAELAGLPAVQPVCVDHGELGDRQHAMRHGAGKGRARIERWIHLLAPIYGLDPALVTAVIEVESGFVVKARSPRNALGVMQLLPATARRFGVRDVFDPVQNLHGGMSYLCMLLDRFRGDLELALAAYNAGEDAVDRYQGIPPYAETRNYVPKVLRHYKRLLTPGEHSEARAVAPDRGDARLILADSR